MRHKTRCAGEPRIALSRRQRWTPSLVLAPVGQAPAIAAWSSGRGSRAGSARLAPAHRVPALWAGVGRIAGDNRGRALATRVRLEHLRPFAPSGRNRGRFSPGFGPHGWVVDQFFVCARLLEAELGEQAKLDRVELDRRIRRVLRSCAPRRQPDPTSALQRAQEPAESKQREARHEPRGASAQHDRLR